MPLPAILAGIIGGIATTLSYLNSLVGEAWTRYFILLGGLAADNAIGAISGVFILEGLLSYVINTVFGLNGAFSFPVYYGVSTLLLIAAFMPLILYLIPKNIDLS